MTLAARVLGAALSLACLGWGTIVIVEASRGVSIPGWHTHVLVPVYGEWPFAVAVAALGAWAGITLCRRGRVGGAASLIGYALQGLGIAAVWYGPRQAGLDCERSPHASLCFMHGAFLSMAGAAVLATGLVVLALALLARRLRRPASAA